MSDLTVVDIKKRKNTDAIAMLEEVIERVESGSITDVGVSWVTSDGSIGGDISEGRNDVLMWASLEHSANSFYKEVINE